MFCAFLNIQFLASFLRSTHPARPSLPASASRPVKIHVGEIKIIRSTGGTHLGGIFRSHPHPPTLVFYHTQKQSSCNQLGNPIWGIKAGFWIMCGLLACVAACVLCCGLCRCVLRVFVVACVFALSCAAFCLCGTSREGKRGATRGKRPWVFSPRAFRADECGRMHSRSALPERCVEVNCFLKIIKII